MNRIEIKINKNPHFIGSWKMQEKKTCEDIIDFFENNPELHKRGQTGAGVDEKVKKSTDITINPKSLEKKEYETFNHYLKHLHECFVDYKEQYPFLKTFVKKIHIGPFNIQKYLSGDHFSKLHSERTDIATLHRLFAWMTYLNDVEDGGTTDFDYYDLKIKPESGKTLIWPAEWTHAHTGSILKSGKKYIITGWLHFTD